MSKPSADLVEQRAHAYAVGELALFSRKLKAYVKALIALPVSPDPEQLNRLHEDFARELQGLVASAFVIGHGAGWDDKEVPRWKR